MLPTLRTTKESELIVLTLSKWQRILEASSFKLLTGAFLSVSRPTAWIYKKKIKTKLKDVHLKSIDKGNPTVAK